MTHAEMSGVEALARGAVEAGVSVVSSYPGEPVSIPVEVLMRDSKTTGMHVEWSVNEKVAFEVALGASYAGLRSMVFVKHVGFNWILDPLAGSAYTGVGGGLVVVAGDDPGATGSTSEQDTRFLAELTELPLLEPATPDEARLVVADAFQLSELVSLPVIVRVVARLCRAVAPVQLGRTRARNRPLFAGQRFVKESILHQHAKLHRKNLRLGRLADASPHNVLSGTDDAELGILTSGSAAGLAHSVSRANPGMVAVLKLGFVRPTPMRLLARFASRHRKLLVAEEVQPFLEYKLMQVRGSHEVCGRSTGHLPWAGPLNASLLANAAGKLLGKRLSRPARETTPPMTRTSLFELEPCSDSFDPGCPHLATFAALREAISESGLPVTVTGDVGCMSLDIKMGHPVIETMTCMGASPAVAAGLKIAMPERRVVAVIGDSSLFHSGMQGILNSVQHSVPVITLVLDNMITAQSGFQPDPGSGRAGRSYESPGLLEEVVGAMGARVVTVDSFAPRLKDVLLKSLRDDRGLVVVSRGKCPVAERTGAYQAMTVR